jgi:hypothetical protein
MKQNIQKELGKIETTIGELIEIVTQIALESGQNEREGYKLASLTLEKILLRDKKHRWQDYRFVM